MLKIAEHALCTGKDGQDARLIENISMADRIEQEFISLDDISGGELYLGLAESYQICHPRQYSQGRQDVILYKHLF